MKGGEGNAAWNNGFFDGYNGEPHKADKGADYDDGYNRGYATSERESANFVWWKKHKHYGGRRMQK